MAQELRISLLEAGIMEGERAFVWSRLRGSGKRVGLV